MIANTPLASLVFVGVASPAILFAFLGGASLINRPLQERWTAWLAAGSLTLSCGALVAALVVHGAAQDDQCVDLPGSIVGKGCDEGAPGILGHLPRLGAAPPRRRDLHGSARIGPASPRARSLCS